jgi:hypothetical protein
MPNSRLLALFLLLLPCCGRALDLSGNVTDQTTGLPVPGATVMILSAGPRNGTSPLCPSSYPDCGKQSVTDVAGQFTLPSVDAALDFCIVALAPGFAPVIESKLLPEKSPVKVKLRARDLATLPAGHVISGRIIGPGGEPVAGAMLDVDGVTQGDSTVWGTSGKIDSMTVSDLEGEFHLVSREDLISAAVLVTAPGRCPRWFRLEPAKMSLLRLKAGASIRGRLLVNGQPLAGIPLTMATEERRCGDFISDMNAETDGDGRFVFTNIPARTKMQLCARMNGLRQQGAAFRLDVTSAEDGQTTDLGDINATPAYRLTGQIVLADGQPVPADTRLMLDRRKAWDTQLAVIEKDGKFTMSAVPGESISLYLTLPGYHLSAENPNLDVWNRRSLSGRVSGDVDGLKILLEPGKEPTPGYEDFEPPSSEAIARAENKPFQGAP